MKVKHINTGKCIWCGRTEETGATFNEIAHILPKALGGKETCPDVCDECNQYFGTAPKGQHGIPCMDHAFKEIFGAIRMFSGELSSESHKHFRSAYFRYFHGKHLVKIVRGFNSKAVTRQFKRSLYEVFLQKYHYETQDGNNPIFEMVRNYARYNIGNPRVFYGFNNLILVPANDYMSHPYLPMGEKIRKEISDYGMFDFWTMGHHFYLEVIPSLATIYMEKYLQMQANTSLIRIRNNERIFEFDDIMQIDFLMQRFVR